FVPAGRRSIARNANPGAIQLAMPMSTRKLASNARPAPFRAFNLTSKWVRPARFSGGSITQMTVCRGEGAGSTLPTSQVWQANYGRRVGLPSGRSDTGRGQRNAPGGHLVGSLLTHVS